MKHTSIGSEDVWVGCRCEYRLNGSSQAQVAGRDIDELTTFDSKEKKGGPLDDAAADCVTM